MNVTVLADLLDFTRDGEWGKGEADHGLVEVGVIRGTDFASVRSGDLSGIPTRYIRASVVEKKQLRPGDVLIETAGGAKDQPTGRTVYLKDDLFERADKPLLCASFARFLRVREGAIDPRFLFWKLQDDYLRDELLPYHVQHTGVARFQYTQFAATHRLVIPDTLEEQKAIAAVLSALDDKIELNRRMNETLETLAQSIFKDWFVDYGPVKRKMAAPSGKGATNPVAILGGLIPDPTKAAPIAALFPDSLGEDGLPRGWERKRTEELALKIAMGPFGSNIKVSTFVESGVPVISGHHLHETLMTQGDHKFIAESHADKLSNSIVFSGDIIFTHAGTIGQVAMVPRRVEYSRYVISQRQFYLRPNTELASPFFLLLYFKSSEGQHVLLSNASQVGVPSIARPSSHLKNIEIATPPKGLMNEFEQLAAMLFDLVDRNGKENRTLAQTRDYLLPKLMSGEARVRDAEKAVS